MDGNATQSGHPLEARLRADLETLTRSICCLRGYANPSPGDLNRISDMLLQRVAPTDLLTDGHLSQLATEQLLRLVVTVMAIDQ